MKRVFVLLPLVFCLFAGGVEAAPCETEPTDMPVAYGDQVICEIDPGTDTDLFRFSGNTGDRILAEALQISGGVNFVPVIKLTAPDGTVLITEWSPARIDLLLPQTGTYTVVVSSFYAATYIGEYAFLVSCTSGSCVPDPPPPPTPAPGGDIPCEAEPTDMFPHYGTRVTCDITPGTDSDLYRFPGIAGDRVLAEAVALSGGVNFVPVLRVIAPDGTILITTWSPGRADLLLPQTGTYTAIVTSFYAATYVGQYAFTVSCTGGKCLPPPFGGPALTLELTGCTGCQPGEQFRVLAKWKNTGSHDVRVEIKVGLRLPDGTPFNVLGNKHLEATLPAGLDVSSNILSFAWPAGLPAGTWTLEGALVGPDVGETFSRDVKTFTVTP